MSKFSDSDLETFILNNNFSDEEYIQIKQRLINLKDNHEKYREICIKKAEEECLKKEQERKKRKEDILFSTSSTSNTSDTPTKLLEFIKLYKELKIEHEDLQNRYNTLSQSNKCSIL